MLGPASPALTDASIPADPNAIDIECHLTCMFASPVCCPQHAVFERAVLVQKSIKSDIRLKQNRDFAIFLVCRTLLQVAASAGGCNLKLFTPR
jgi:hypothetical protein